MNRILIALLVLGLAAEPAAAGPWPRTPGEVFAALSREIRDGGGWDALYAEYGMSDRLTFVLDAGRGGGGGWRAVAGLRVPVWQVGVHRFAVSFGAGVEHPQDGDLPADPILSSLALAGLAPLDSTVYPVVQVGAGWGMGFETRLGAGWATVDVTQRRILDIGLEERKMDTTLGLNLRDSSAILGQIQYSDPRVVAPQIRLGLGWVEHFGPISVEAGLGRHLRHDQEMDAKIGLWLRF